MGEDIGVSEKNRFSAELTNAIKHILATEPKLRWDSPVYKFIDKLTPPMIAEEVKAATTMTATTASASLGPTGAVGSESAVHSQMMERVLEARKKGDWLRAKMLLEEIREMRKTKDPNTPVDQQTEDPYIIQQLALVTYKAKHDTPEKEIAALREACDLLYKLNPTTSNDTETLGLWGAVHKRLWDKAKDTVALDKAIRSYERGFSLRNDYYNGINFAFLLNVRAAHAADLAKASASPAESARQLAAAIADFVQAERVREEVLTICAEWIKSSPVPDEKATEAARKQYLNNKYWVVATKAEAYLGTGQTAEAEATYQEAYALEPALWMIESTKEQRGKLEPLLADSPLKYVRTGELKC